MKVEDQPFEDVSPFKNGDFPLSCDFSGGLRGNFRKKHVRYRTPYFQWWRKSFQLSTSLWEHQVSPHKAPPISRCVALEHLEIGCFWQRPKCLDKWTFPRTWLAYRTIGRGRMYILYIYIPESSKCVKFVPCHPKKTYQKAETLHIWKIQVYV